MNAFFSLVERFLMSVDVKNLEATQQQSAIPTHAAHVSSGGELHSVTPRTKLLSQHHPRAPLR